MSQTIDTPSYTIELSDGSIRPMTVKELAIRLEQLMYTHIEKIRIMNDAVVFMFGCMTLVCEIRVGSFLFFEMNVILLLLGTAEICLACFMYYQEFMLPEVKACREREAKRRAERLMRQAERDVRKEWTLYDK